MSQVKKLITAAKMYQQYGIVCVPTILGDKRPRGEGWQKTTETDFDTFTSDVKGMGIVTGAASNLTCVDIDDNAMWQAVLNYYKAHDQFDECAREVTPTGSIHYYFAYDAALLQGDHVVNARDPEGNMIVFDGKANNTANPNRVGFDIRNDGGFVVCAPSLYAAGRSKAKAIYNDKPLKWHVGIDDIEGQFMECPKWLHDLLTKKTEIRLDSNGKITDIRAPKITITKKVADKPVVKPVIKPAGVKANEKEQEAKEEDEEEAEEIDPFDVVLPDEETEKRHTLATVEEIKEGLEILNPADYGSYAEWCNLLWSVARGTDAAELDEDIIIDLLDEFCQKAPGYESKAAVTKKYNESGKRAGQQSKVTFGSFRHWVKAAKLAKHSAAKAAAKAHRTELVNALNAFNHTDVYKWNNFKHECQSEDFHSIEAACEFIAKRINRVLARVTTGNGFYLKKDKAHLVTKVKDIAGKAGCDFTITYTSWKVDKRNTKNPKPPVPEDKETKLSKIIDKVDILTDYSACNYYKDPATCPEGDFNQWEGIKAKRIEQTEESKESIKHVLSILHELYADGDEQTYRWLLAYFKEIIVGAKRPNGVCLFLYSKLHGAGKNTFVDWFRSYVVGDHASHTFTGLAQACDKHNTLAEGKILMIIDELASAGALCAEFIELIKTNITNKKLLLNPKGLSMYEVTNWCNWIMMSNYMDGINIDANDRRFTCLEVNQKYVGNKEHWVELYAKLENQDVADAFYTYLLELDTSGYPSPYHPHHTPLRERMQRLKAGSVVAFTEYLTETENIKRVIYEQWEESGSEDKSEESPQEPHMVWAADELYRTYKQWCVDNIMKVKPRPYYNADLNYGPKNVPLLERTKSSSIYYIIPEKDVVIEVKPVFESKKTKARALKKKQAAKPVEESDDSDSVVVEHEDNVLD